MDGCASLAQRGKFGKFDNTEAQRQRHRDRRQDKAQKNLSVLRALVF